MFNAVLRTFQIIGAVVVSNTAVDIVHDQGKRFGKWRKARQMKIANRLSPMRHPPQGGTTAQNDPLVYE